jgi:hypothetical protein
VLAPARDEQDGGQSGSADDPYEKPDPPPAHSPFAQATAIGRCRTRTQNDTRYLAAGSDRMTGRTLRVADETTVSPSVLHATV